MAVPLKIIWQTFSVARHPDPKRAARQTSGLDGKLYRWQGFKTFEEYCQKRWNWGRIQGWNYIAAAKVAANVHSNEQNGPSLTQAVHLATLPPDHQRAVAEVVDFSQTTVRELRDIVQDIKDVARPFRVASPTNRRACV